MNRPRPSNPLVSSSFVLLILLLVLFRCDIGHEREDEEVDTTALDLYHELQAEDTLPVAPAG